jgi:hypothetical protein
MSGEKMDILNAIGNTPLVELKKNRATQFSTSDG